MTSIRFFAALWVVLRHYTYSWHYPVLPTNRLTTPIANGIAAGHMGVNLFFVLSGFILAYTYTRLDGIVGGGWAAFLQARAARILPGYWLSFAFTGLLLSEINRRPATWIGWRVVTLTQAWGSGSATIWNPPGWSLSVEFFCYALFPVLLPLVWRVPVRLTLPLAGCIWLVGTTPSVWYVLVGSPSGWHDGIYWSPISHLPEFLIGILGCRWYGVGRPVPRAILPSALLGLAVVAGTGIVPDAVLRGPGADLFFLPVILSLSANQVNWLALPAFITLGETSYALYLFHWPLLQACTYWVGAPSGIEDVPYFAVYLVLAVCTALLIYRFVELPARAALRSFGRRKRGTVGAAPILQ